MRRRLRVYTICRIANGVLETFNRDGATAVFFTSERALEVASHLVEGDGWNVCLSELNLSLESAVPVVPVKKEGV